jgi:hypothetical protein
MWGSVAPCAALPNAAAATVTETHKMVTMTMEEIQKRNWNG